MQWRSLISNLALKSTHVEPNKPVTDLREQRAMASFRRFLILTVIWSLTENVRDRYRMENASRGRRDLLHLGLIAGVLRSSSFYNDAIQSLYKVPPFVYDNTLEDGA